MSGGLRTSVKGYLIAQRLNLAADALPENEAISDNVTAPLDLPSQPVEEMTMDSATCGSGICDGNIPCVPMLHSAKSMASYLARIRVPLSHQAAEPGTGMDIAITRLNQQSILHSPKEWMKEIGNLAQLIHPNIVELIGYCLEDDRRLLVSECMANGGLDMHLFGGDSYLQPLSWMQRIKIAIGAAKGLAFLHSDEANTIHGNFKSSKILLDSDFNVKLYGYGVSGEQLLDSHRHASRDAFRLSNQSLCIVPPVWEYAAPEVKDIGIDLTAKSDVYSFGVVMLELLSGRRARDLHRPRKEHNLVEWAKPYLVNARKYRVLQVFDARIEGQYSVAAALRAAKIAYLCLSTKTKFRPMMSDVVRALERLQKWEEDHRHNERHQNLHASSTVPIIEEEA